MATHLNLIFYSILAKYFVLLFLQRNKKGPNENIRYFGKTARIHVKSASAGGSDKAKCSHCQTGGSNQEECAEVSVGLAPHKPHLFEAVSQSFGCHDFITTQIFSDSRSKFDVKKLEKPEVLRVMIEIEQELTEVFQELSDHQNANS